jgi:glycosyltransferase involved in cell wall biosynthesis
MAKYVGVKNNRIFIVSDKPFINPEMEIIEVPEELINLSTNDLILNCSIKNNQIKYNNTKNFNKVAFVSNWKMRCGISSYFESLGPEIAKRLKDFKLFIEENDITTGDVLDFGDIKLQESQVVSCWKRGESLQLLVKKLKEYDPDIILINHEWGIFPNARYWLAMMNQLSDYRVIVIMHSIFHHKDKTIVEASIPEMVVHLEGAKQVLKEEKNISGQVYVVPHGCEKYNDHRLWNFYKSDKTVIQFGYLFKYKAWEVALHTIALLKNKYNDIFFTGLCSESPYAKVEHQLYYNELMLLIDELGIQENVSLIRGFQSDEVLDSYLRTNKIAIFPYVSTIEHEVFGVSGAARMCMATGMPVISSSVNHFSDLNTIKADTAEQMAEELDKLFSNSKLINQQVEKQKEYVEQNSWANIAQHYIKIFSE